MILFPSPTWMLGQEAVSHRKKVGLQTGIVHKDKNRMMWHINVKVYQDELVICLNQTGISHHSITSCWGCFDVHFMHSAQLCVAFSFLFAFFFFFMAQFPFQRTNSTNWRTVGSRVRPNHSKPPFLRLDHPCLFFIPFFPILCPIWIPNPNFSKILVN